MRPIALFLLAATAATPAAAQTAMFRGTPDHLGNYAGATPTLQTLVWKFKTGGRVISSPAVAAGPYTSEAPMETSTPSIARPERSAGSSPPRVRFTSPARRERTGLRRKRGRTLLRVDSATGQEKWTFATKGERRFTAPEFTARCRAPSGCPIRSTSFSPRLS
jgi:hypothetical protein